MGQTVQRPSPRIGGKVTLAMSGSATWVDRNSGKADTKNRSHVQHGQYKSIAPAYRPSLRFFNSRFRSALRLRFSSTRARSKSIFFRSDFEIETG